MAKYDITKAKRLKFARFGGLSSVIQEGYKSKSEGFHSPPATRGFYAFVWPYYEMFLLGGYANMVWKTGSKFIYVRDKNGNIINDKHPDYDKICDEDRPHHWSVQTKKFSAHKEKYPDYDAPDYDVKADALDKEWEDNHKDEPKWVFVEKSSPRIFEFGGELWHHLGDRLKPFQVLARHGSWSKSSVEDFRAALEKEMHAARKNERNYCGVVSVAMPSTKSPFRMSGKDHLEVFIEKI